RRITRQSPSVPGMPARVTAGGRRASCVFLSAAPPGKPGFPPAHTSCRRVRSCRFARYRARERCRGPMGRRIEMAELDPNKGSPLDWVVIGAGGLAFIDSFLPWYTASVSFSGISRSDSAGAWSAGFAAWFSVLLLMAAGGLVLANAMGAQIKLP